MKMTDTANHPTAYADTCLLDFAVFAAPPQYAW